ncbi:MAG TPA: 2-C-methyl-D-erythritol 2,4-cyclodiphosphate synthase [Candidatus Limnocylindrales bacterium]|nr:2-C-methyl-D-erythritol 2,4-cyclodiphosphate synthase [Candidatus Limnocylindrales bacterium]
MRVGNGYDSHRFDAAAPLVLGGVTIPNHAGLAGHSDGDAVAHAVIDAVLGAACCGDVGSHFPPTDEKWKGANSIGLLEKAMEIVRARGWRVLNVDVTVICESPKVRPHADGMRACLAGALGVSPGRVSIKGKTNEGMGWIGAGEGIAVHAVALIESTQRQ